jgi:transposase
MHKQLTKDLFRTYALSGMNYNHIAKKLKISRGTVFNWRKEMNLLPRKRGAGSPCRVKKAR